MRAPTFALAVALLALAGCAKQPEGGAATANADVLADQLEAKADNLDMLADNSTDSEAAVAMQNASETLDEQSANLRAADDPNVKAR